MPTKLQVQEQGAARDELREILKPGDTVYTTLEHVSRSGMMRVVNLRVFRDDAPLRLTWSACKATGYKYNTRHEGMELGGCGMDMGFAAVYALSSALFPDGFDCIGEAARCPSNDHSNDRGTRDYSPTRHHASGGYALLQRWL